MDVFLNKGYRPMLIGREAPPFDDDAYLFELKLDGIRCLAYLNEHDVSLVTRRGLELASRLPELREIHKNVAAPCVLDGELVALSGGVPDFEKAKDRALSTDSVRARRLAKTAPVSFVVFDLLYLDGVETIREPLDSRRKLLESAVIEDGRITMSRAIEGKGINFFKAAEARGLEGVIAKRKASLYYPGTRTSDWVKCKNLLEDDFVICGYIRNKNRSISLVLGQYDKGGVMAYMGHVVLNEGEDYATVLKLGEASRPPFEGRPIPANNEGAIWVVPDLVCRVTFLARTGKGLRQPVFKEIRIDKAPEDAFVPANIP